MERYIALLRSVNIGGKNKIAMSELKAVFVESGFGNVVTCLNSGNVVFDSDAPVGAESLEDMLERKFGIRIPVYVSLQSELRARLAAAPEWWGTDDKGIYDNLIFVLPPKRAEEIRDAVGAATEGLEQVYVGDGVIYHSFDRQAYGKCRWWKKTAEKGIAEHLTIRTANTARKITGI